MALKTRNYMDIPRNQWKSFRIIISGGLCNSYYIAAPNKTMARLFVKGELNPQIKIVRIEEDK